MNTAGAANLWIQILAGELSLSRLLEQSQGIAIKLGIEEVAEWLNLELIGYPKDAEPPDYRKVLTQRLEIYNTHRAVWLPAGYLNLAFPVRQAIGEIERLSREQHVPLPVVKNFSVKNDWGDSFGSDWPQRLLVAGSEYQKVLNGVVERWLRELEDRGLQICDADKFVGALGASASDNLHSDPHPPMSCIGG